MLLIRLGDITIEYLKLSYFLLQVSSESDVKQAIKTVVDKCGPLRAAVNTAAIVKIAETLSDAGEVHPHHIFEEITKV